jgi:hypothetical protein
MKMVINKCYGGFGLSHEGVMRYAELKGITLYYENDGFTSSYYTIPVDEFHKLHAESKKTQDFSKINSVYFCSYDMPRTDPDLIQVVEELGEKANGDFAELKVVDIPDGVGWEIDDYDGIESVHEIHRVWD